MKGGLEIMSPENCFALTTLVEQIVSSSVDPTETSAQLTIVRDALLDEISACAALAPLHTPYCNPRAFFPFAMLPSPSDHVPRCDLRLRNVNVVTCVHDLHYKLIPILHALENGDPFEPEKLNGGQDYAVYYHDINTLVVLEGKHHIFAAKKLHLDVTLPHIPTYNLLDCGYHPSTDGEHLTWLNLRTGENICNADPRVAAIYTITEALNYGLC